MGRYRLLAVLIFSGFLVGTSVHAEPRKITWDLLVPAATEYKNPFTTLGANHMDALRMLARLQPGVDAGDAGAVAKTAKIRKTLEEAGLDVDWLKEQRLKIIQLRTAAATAVSEDLVGKSIMLPGYIVPLEFDDENVVEFLLVPTAGACIHTPPPPANQIVHVTYPQGFKFTSLQQPVWISGKMQTGTSQHNVGYIDGQSVVDVTYTMTPVNVEPY